MIFCTAHWDFRRCWLCFEFGLKGRRSSSEIWPDKFAKNATFHRTATLQEVRVHLCLNAWCMVVEPLTKRRGQSSIHSRWILLKRRCSPCSILGFSNGATPRKVCSDLMRPQNSPKRRQVQRQQPSRFGRMGTPKSLRQVDDVDTRKLLKELQNRKTPNGWLLLILGLFRVLQDAKARHAC